MTFEDHLAAHRSRDGSYDLAATQQARAAELAASEQDRTRLAAKAAQAERAAWEKRETANLRKQLTQPALCPELELEVLVPLGDNVAVALGDMNLDRIRLRRDMRLKHHLRENRAFDAEVSHWLATEQVLAPHETLREYLGRQGE